MFSHSLLVVKIKSKNKTLLSERLSRCGFLGIEFDCTLLVVSIVAGWITSVSLYVNYLTIDMPFQCLTAGYSSPFSKKLRKKNYNEPFFMSHITHCTLISFLRNPLIWNFPLLSLIIGLYVRVIVRLDGNRHVKKKAKIKILRCYQAW